ncbi:MAG: hypothetical protein HXX10_07440 [Rhodoplanes sp.]|nr:hypothetical protein [Rhodoplanes sp.]NVO13853.1 hypothetical protein [Rhodoplanes sp.]
MIKRTIQTLTASRWQDGTLMYPGRYLLTWFKSPHMPWVLLSMEPAE